LLACKAREISSKQDGKPSQPVVHSFTNIRANDVNIFSKISAMQRYLSLHSDTIIGANEVKDTACTRHQQISVNIP
jgi:hypothetical protein